MSPSTKANRCPARLSLSSSALLRRVRRLKATGYILGIGESSIVNRAFLAPRLTAFVLIQLSAAAKVPDFCLGLAKLDEVQYIGGISGDFDAIAIVTVHDMNEFNAFADAHLASGSLVLRYQSAFTRKVAKDTHQDRRGRKGFALGDAAHFFRRDRIFLGPNVDWRRFQRCTPIAPDFVIRPATSLAQRDQLQT